MKTVTSFAALEPRNAPALDRLRAGDLDSQELLGQLLTTSCLLEVSKLLTTGVDLATFAVDGDHAARDVGRRVAREEQRGADDLLG